MRQHHQHYLQQNNAAPYSIEFLQLFISDLYFRAGKRKEALSFLSQYTDSNNKLLSPLALLQKADILSSPYSSPLVWNTFIQFNTAAGNDLPWQVEQKEIFEKDNVNIEDSLTIYKEL